MIDKPFDPTKPCMTRDGRKARIVCTDKRGERSIIALVASTFFDEERCWSFLANGKYTPQVESPHDLINVPEVTTKVAYTYRNSKGDVWCKYVGNDCKDSPDSSSYLGYVEWTFEDGEPVSCRFVKGEK